jgi:hypothetical protein
VLSLIAHSNHKTTTLLVESSTQGSFETKPRGHLKETKKRGKLADIIKMVDEKKNAAVKKFREKERKEKVEKEAREKKAKQLREDYERLRKKNEELRQSEKRQKEFLKKCREAKQ